MLANLTAMVGEPANSNSPRGSQVRCVYCRHVPPLAVSEALRTTDSSIHRVSVTRLLVFVAVAMSCGDANAAALPSPLTLTANQAASVARAFAPILVFHPLERYFPISPMMRLGHNVVPSGAGDGGDEARTTPDGLETWPTRVAGYGALSQADKLSRAALGYRVFSRLDHRDRLEIVVEYWCYYVYNEFTVRGTWLPYRVRDNHPHDLERLYLVLTPTEAAGASDDAPGEAWARRAFRIRRVVANAHDGSIPPNQYDVSDDDMLTPPLTVLVERGSHAMAPDVDHDGRFTPGVDSTAALKLQWGIRDTGATGSRYRASFMDDRDASSTRLCGPADANTTERDDCPRYALFQSDDVQSWFEQFELSSRDRSNVLGRSSWWVRTFGDVQLETLMVPSDPPDGKVLDAMVRRQIRGQNGFLVGLTGVTDSPAFIIGRRYFWNVGHRRAPDIAGEFVALLSVGRPVIEATLWGSYTVDAITNVVIGGGWFSERQLADVEAGTDLRVGRFTVRPTWRVREGRINARVTMTF